MKLFQPNIPRLEKRRDVSKLLEVIQLDPFGELAIQAAEALDRVDGSGRSYLLHYQHGRAQDPSLLNETLSQRFPVLGDLSADDLQIIQSELRNELPIMSVAAHSTGSVFVRTGEYRGPLDGEGHVFLFEKHDGDWKGEVIEVWSS